MLETRPEETGTAFLLQTPEGEEYGILLPEGSRLSSALEDFDPEAFRRGQGQEAAISAEFFSPVEDLSFSGGEALPSYAAEWVEVTGYRQEEPLILEDGSQVFLWQYAGARAYTLPEGQELLWAHDPGSPDQSWTAGTESFASLPSPVQARILEYYRAQGPLYEEQADLSDPALRSEMEAAFSGRSLLFFPEHLEIAFPAGSLPSQEHSYLLGLDWDEELSALLQPWALPYPPENS